MLAHKTYAVVNVRRVGRVAVLHGEAISVVDKGGAVWYIMSSQTRQLSRSCWRRKLPDDR
jgi:hypothetical protein